MSPQLREILRQTSRSFGLSVRFLPRAMRQPVGLAYLCARLSDTIADEASLPAPKRLHLLEQLRHACLDPSQALEPSFAQELQELKQSLEHEGEVQLAAQAAPLLQQLAQVPSEIQAQIQAVLRPILAGQQADIERFELAQEAAQEAEPMAEQTAENKPLRSLQSGEELLEYCWQVAGCVGEFWGNLGRLSAPQAFPTEQELPELAQLGSDYGQALQLINILRDLPKDAAQGRCYLPGNWASAQQAWQEASPEWLACARQKLTAATRYCASLNSLRLRLATALPAAIGWKTLSLLERASYQELETRLKIPRSQVYRLVAQAMFAARTQSSMEAWISRLSQR